MFLRSRCPQKVKIFLFRKLIFLSCILFCPIKNEICFCCSTLHALLSTKSPHCDSLITNIVLNYFSPCWNIFTRIVARHLNICCSALDFFLCDIFAQIRLSWWSWPFYYFTAKRMEMWELVCPLFSLPPPIWAFLYLLNSKLFFYDFEKKVKIACEIPWRQKSGLFFKRNGCICLQVGGTIKFLYGRILTNIAREVICDIFALFWSRKSWQEVEKTDFSFCDRKETGGRSLQVLSLRRCYDVYIT